MNEIESGRRHAFCALGSNIDAERNLPRAVDCLRRFGVVDAVSAVYESAPVDGSDQPNYLNAAVLLLTDLSAAELCTASLPAVESELGRVRDPHDRNAPRTIDVDLALYDRSILEIGRRRIPDPQIAERAFLAIPLSELRGGWIVPPNGTTLDELAAPHRRADVLIRRDDVVLKPGATPCVTAAPE